MRLSRRQLTGLIVLALMVMAVIVVRVLIKRPLDGSIEFAWPAASAAKYRFTSIGCGMIVGVALAVSGVMLQALLRNPLASPFVLGLSSGAGLGVMIAIYVAYRMHGMMMRPDEQVGPALAGSIVTLGIVYLFGRRRGRLDPLTLVLAGVVVASVCSSLILMMHRLVLNAQTAGSGFLRWMMGHISETPNWTMAIVGGMTVVGLVVGLLMGRAMDAATLDDDEARSIGLPIGGVRLLMFLLAGALAAGAVALAGPIGFVGLISPHAARLVLGPRHGPLVLGAALVGIVVVVGADVARQVIVLDAGRMPVGVFTALIGGPAFIWLLSTGRGQS